VGEENVKYSTLWYSRRKGEPQDSESLHRQGILQGWIEIPKDLLSEQGKHWGLLLLRRPFPKVWYFDMLRTLN
jgi:hypothetical protein